MPKFAKEYPDRLKPCEACGNIIPKETNRNWNMYAKKRFCSMKCCGMFKDQAVTCACMTCGKTMERSPSHVRGKVYCSQACRRNAKEYTCEICCKKFMKRPSERSLSHIYCSRKCQGIAKRKNKPQTQGRRSPEDLAWKMSILRRDNFKCQHCGADRKLEAHHIKETKDFPELRHDINNGLTLCHQCHYYGVHNGMPNFIHGRYSKQHHENLVKKELL